MTRGNRCSRVHVYDMQAMIAKFFPRVINARVSDDYINTALESRLSSVDCHWLISFTHKCNGVKSFDLICLVLLQKNVSFLVLALALLYQLHIFQVL